MKLNGFAFAAIVGGLSYAGLPMSAAGQAAQNQPLQGTIRVQEGDRYRDLARITEAQARAAAEKAVPGAEFRDADLEEEDGFLIYEVELRENGRDVEIYVDAGNAAVLLIDRDDD